MISAVDSKSRWVVAHLGARDRYQLPLALHESGQLETFVTDWYSPLDFFFMDSFLKCVPQSFGSTFTRRYLNELPSKLVKDMKLSCVRKLLLRTDIAEIKLNRKLGEYAAQIASNSGSNLLITSYYGWAAFPRLNEGTKKVLFQIHPHPWFLRTLYSKLNCRHETHPSFDSELEMRVTEKFLNCWGRESLDADVVIAASKFTRHSLLEVGVSAEKIHVVPYGVDSLVFRNDIAAPSGKPKVLFVGQPTARKGLGNLLNVWQQLNNSKAELHIATGTTANEPKNHSGGGIFWYNRLSLPELVELMNRSDLIVLPSIAEGFGHVLLEGLSCGTPILCSNATAGPDILNDWEDGFIFPGGDWNSLAARLDYWLSNIDRLRRLRGAARSIAESLPWTKFRSGVRNICNG